MDLVTWAFENARQWGDKPIYVDAFNPHRRVNAVELEACVRKLIAGLRASGVRAGDTVCVLSFNSIWYTALYLAIIGAGGRFVGANPAYTPGELEHVFKVAEVKTVIVQPDLVEKAWTAGQAVGLSRDDISVFDADGGLTDTHGFKSWRSLLSHGEADWLKFEDDRQAEMTVANLIMTSGTTGMPKAAMMSHRALVGQAVMTDDPEKKHEIRRLLSIPQFHSYTISMGHFWPLRHGHTTYIMSRFDFERYVQSIATFKITEIAIAPPIAYLLLGLPASRTTELASVRHIWCGGAPLPVEMQERFIGMFSQKTALCQVWGMSETGWITTFSHSERDNTGSVGRLIEGIEARAMTTSGQELDEGLHGEICVRTPSAMLGYLNNPEATNSTLIDGWLRTGDIGYGRDGKWYVTDREKDMIKVRAWQVSPTEVEACLLTHEAIRDAAVVGINIDSMDGERPRAYIVLKPDLEYVPSEDDIKIHVSDSLAKYKALTGGVCFLDAIPRNASGKILRKILKKQAMHEIESHGRVDAKTEVRQTQA